MIQCLCFYAQEHENFRIQELKSLCSLFNINVKIYEDEYTEQKPYLIIEVPSFDDVHKILSRSVLLKSISELWVHNINFEMIGHCDSQWKEKLHENFRAGIDTFKFEVEVFNKRITLVERINYIEEIQKYVEIPGDVNLKDPTVVFSMMLDFRKESLDHVYFGRLIGYSQRNVIHKYSLKTRYFIGNTSMDPQLALIMANQAQVRDGSFCYDPFIGTGSIIVACSHFGGFSGGSDIDYNIVYGRGKSSRAGNNNFRARDEIVRTNFDNYNLIPHYWDVLAADATHMPFRSTEIFDAIVTDPPYGIREGGRKLGSKKDTTWEIPEDVRKEHIPAKKHHTLSNIIMDLLKFAFKYLVVGGRVVFWLPVYKPRYTEDLIPTHPGMRLVGNSEQSLTNTVSRRLITMVKVKKLSEYESVMTDSNAEEWIQQQNDFRKNYFSKYEGNLKDGKANLINDLQHNSK